jgi:nucleotide-binding universal stress UspA family protein
MENPDTGWIIVGIGHSAGGHQALRYAVAEARRRRIPLLAVRTLRVTPRVWGPIGDEPVWPPLDEQIRATVAQVERAFAETFGGMPADVPVTVVTPEGGPAEVLVSLARDESDLLVVGGCGARRAFHFRTTWIARYCARHAPCPTVIVPPTSMARAGSPRHLAREVTTTAAALLREDPPESRRPTGPNSGTDR